jgi:hypothetical protein
MTEHLTEALSTFRIRAARPHNRTLETTTCSPPRVNATSLEPDIAIVHGDESAGQGSEAVLPELRLAWVDHGPAVTRELGSDLHLLV